MVMGEKFKNKVKGKNGQYDYLDDVVCSMVGGRNLNEHSSISE